MKTIIVDHVVVDREFLPPYCTGIGIRVNLLYCQVSVPSWQDDRIGRMLGVDPGITNFGLCWLEKYWGNGSFNCVIAQFSLPSKMKMADRIEVTTLGAEEIITSPRFRPKQLNRAKLGGLTYPRTLPNYGALIESSAIGAKFGQAPLSENRACMVMAVRNSKLFRWIKDAPPMTITKEVFGSGKIKSKEYFMPELKGFPDGASALGCALYLFRKGGQRE